MREYSVYKHTFPNGKVYIGITKQNPLKRWRNGTGYKGQPDLTKMKEHISIQKNTETKLKNITRANIKAH